jgi:hypothetical protein
VSTTTVIIITIIIHAVVMMMDFDSHQDNDFKASNTTDDSFILNSTDCVSRLSGWHTRRTMAQSNAAMAAGAL